MTCLGQNTPSAPPIKGFVIRDGSRLLVDDLLLPATDASHACDMCLCKSSTVYRRKFRSGPAVCNRFSRHALADNVAHGARRIKGSHITLQASTITTCQRTQSGLLDGPTM